MHCLQHEPGALAKDIIILNLFIVPPPFELGGCHYHVTQIPLPPPLFPPLVCLFIIHCSPRGSANFFLYTVTHFYPFIFFILPIHFIEFDHTGDLWRQRPKSLADQVAAIRRLQYSHLYFS